MPADPELLGRTQRMRRQLAEAGPEVERTDGDFLRVSVPHGDGDVLRDVLFAETARVVIEIGLAYGSSALAIAEALVSHGTHGDDQRRPIRFITPKSPSSLRLIRRQIPLPLRRRQTRCRHLHQVGRGPPHHRATSPARLKRATPGRGMEVSCGW